MKLAALALALAPLAACGTTTTAGGPSLGCTAWTVAHETAHAIAEQHCTPRDSVGGELPAVEACPWTPTEE